MDVGAGGGGVNRSLQIISNRKTTIIYARGKHDYRERERETDRDRQTETRIQRETERGYSNAKTLILKHSRQ